MSHSNTIILVVTGSIASTLGVYVAIRKIIQYTRPPVNTLVRHGDIQLDYIEPTRPGHTYQPVDLENIHHINFENIDN
jgi:hypothetical protein